MLLNFFIPLLLLIVLGNYLSKLEEELGIRGAHGGAVHQVRSLEICIFIHVAGGHLSRREGRGKGHARLFWRVGRDEASEDS